MKLEELLLFTVLILVECCHGTAEQTSMRMRMKDIRTNADFIRAILQNKLAAEAGHQSEDESQIFSSDEQTQKDLNEEAVEKLASLLATPDHCETRPTTVAIPHDSDPRIIHWPTCTTINRCGGCCVHESVECAPTKVKTVNVTVGKYNEEFRSYSTIHIPLEEHISCDCLCRIKQSDCYPETQYYDKESCSCRCRQSHDETTCTAPKRWDEKRCSCVCSVLVNCLDDEYFDYNTCRCARGTPIISREPISFISASIKCASHRCRGTLRPVFLDNRCQCRP